MRSSTHTSSIKKPSPGSPAGSSIGDHHRNFRTHKIGALRNVCGPRDFDAKVALARPVSITGTTQRNEKMAPLGRLGEITPIGTAFAGESSNSDEMRVIAPLLAISSTNTHHSRAAQVGRFVTVCGLFGRRIVARKDCLFLRN